MDLLKLTDTEVVQWLDEHKAPYHIVEEKDGTKTKRYDTTIEWFVTVITELENENSKAKRGAWVDNGIAMECSICGKAIVVEQGTAEMNYCPNCGVKMDADCY